MDETNELNPILKELLDFVNGWKSQKGISPTAVLSGDTLEPVHIKIASKTIAI